MRTSMKGPKSFEEWMRVYEERDSDTEYILSPGELGAWHPMHGFFTYIYDAESRTLLIPKMCGDGKRWRRVIYGMVVASAPDVCRGALCCTKRNPVAYTRILGGNICGVERSYDFNGKKGTTLWYIFITPDDTKEGRHC